MLTIATFWFVFALLLALIEIEIEGKHGWAEDAPTWYRTTGIAGRLYGLFMNGKPLTGYHLWMLVFTIMIFHVGFFMGAEWTPSTELITMAKYFIWAVFWDFLWFVFNFNYGISNFKKDKIWWHKKWLLNIVPIDYVSGLCLSLALAYIASVKDRDFTIIGSHFLFIAWLLIFSSVGIAVIAPIYKCWHQRMREKDDRSRAGIFH